MIFINTHEIVLDQAEKLQAWTDYGSIVDVAMNFIKNCPVDPANGLPWYLQYSCFWTDPLRPVDWPDNPAGKFAWATTTLLKYYPYSGDTAHIRIVGEMLDRLWQNRTPQDFAWAGVPYASAHPGTGVYFGARADGEYATEPDKIAQVGRAYLDFYQLTQDERYLSIGEHCAQVLLEKLRPGDAGHSPLPFRVDVRDGKVIEEYTAHMIAVVRLFDSLIALGQTRYQEGRDQVWDWISRYPLTNNLWKGYFEDIRLDPHNENRDQLSPLETARYILEHKEAMPDWQASVKALILWVKETLGSQPFFSSIPIHEQKFCNFWMGSHTARFAGLCALYAEAAGDSAFSKWASGSFNWASYMANEDGLVTVGVDRPDYYNQCWFTDGFFDYVPHFIDGMAAMSEYAPADEDHLLRSTSIVRHIDYRPNEVCYRTADAQGTQRLRLTFRPQKIMAGKLELQQKEQLSDEPGWVLGDIPYVIDVRAGAQEVCIYR